MAVLFVRMGLAVLGLLIVVPASYATKIQRIASPGGIEAWLVEDYTVPMVAMNFAFTGGSSQDPEAKPGVANMLSGLLDEGAGDLDSKAFQAALDDRSIRMGFDAGRDNFFGSLTTLAEESDEAFRLLALAVQKPRFDDEPVGRIRAQIDSNIKSNSKDPETIAMLAMCATAFPNHPYGRPVDGTEATLATIAATDLEAYRQRVFARDTLKVAIVGAIAPQAASAMLDRVFGPLPAKATLTPIPDQAPAGGFVEIDLPNPQSIIRFGGPGLKRSDPDFMAAYLVNHVLGGGSFSSRLYTEIREKRGLAYSISTTLVPMSHAGAVAGGTATRADRADETLGLIKAQLAKFAAEGPTAEELAKAKSYLIGSYALRFDSSGKIARQLLAIMLDNLGIDYVDKRNEQIANISLADAKRVAKRLFETGANTIVVVGPRKPEAASKS